MEPLTPGGRIQPLAQGQFAPKGFVCEACGERSVIGFIDAASRRVGPCCSKDKSMSVSEPEPGDRPLQSRPISDLYPDRPLYTQKVDIKRAIE